MVKKTFVHTLPDVVLFVLGEIAIIIKHFKVFVYKHEDEHICVLCNLMNLINGFALDFGIGVGHGICFYRMGGGVVKSWGGGIRTLDLALIKSPL